jgi:hypothetical protein
VPRSRSFVSPTSAKGRGSVTASPTVVSVMAGGWPGHRLFDRRFQICVHSGPSHDGSDGRSSKLRLGAVPER